MPKAKTICLCLILTAPSIIPSCELSENTEDVVGDGAVKLVNKASEAIWYDISRGELDWEFFNPIQPDTVRVLRYNYLARKFRGGESYVLEWWYKVSESEQGFIRSDVFSKQIMIETGKYTVITWNEPDYCSISFEGM